MKPGQQDVLLRQLLVGRCELLQDGRTLSGITKRPTSSAVMLREHGLDGDEQADRRHHGGAEKALHHYPFEHYDRWRRELSQSAATNAAGAFGENLSTVGMTEQTVSIGDIYRLGGALIQVSQGRQPCWKLNLRFASSTMARRVQDSGRIGWYYRVLQTGMIAAGDTLRLVDRPCEHWTVARLWRAFYVDVMNVQELEAIATLPHLALNWQQHARRRLQTRKVEDWSQRLSES